MNAVGERLVRLLGADPAVFAPVARAHALIMKRQARLARQRAGWISRHIQPFYLLCAAASVSGVAISSIALAVAPPLPGAAAVFTFGTIFLLLIIIVDDFDVLVNPSEYLVLAAHPHDAWSVLLAKIVVVGRSIATLGTCYFVPGAIIITLSSRNPLAGAAFLAGAGCLTIAVASGGMLLAAALLALWGRRALDRLLPLVQALYLVTILFSTMGKRTAHQLEPVLSHVRVALWYVPTTWFLWPLELVLGPRTEASWIRAALSTGILIGLIASGASWIGGRFGERLLDPPPVRAKRRDVGARRERLPGGARARIALAGRGPEARAIMKLASAHLRSDIRFRSNMMATTFTPLILLSSIYVGRSTNGFAGRPEFAVSILALGLATLLGSVVRILTLSSRPGALWCVLTSPTSRRGFSLATISVVRAFVMIPYLVVVAGIVFALKGGPPWAIALTLLGMCVLMEALLRFWRGFYHAIPFSLPMRSAGQMGGAQVLTTFGGMLMGAGAVTVLPISQRLGVWAQVVALLVFSGGLVAATYWSRWRVSRAAEAFEIGPDEVRL